MKDLGPLTNFLGLALGDVGGHGSDETYLAIGTQYGHKMHVEIPSKHLEDLVDALPFQRLFQD